MFPGFAERMQKEMVAMAPPAATVEILLNVTALLGSLLNNINFGNMCISKQDYAVPGLVLLLSRLLHNCTNPIWLQALKTIRPKVHGQPWYRFYRAQICSTIFC